MHVCVYIDMHVQRRHVNLHEPIQNTMLSMRLQRKKRNQAREREKENDQQNNVETFCLAKVC